MQVRKTDIHFQGQTKQPLPCSLAQTQDPWQSRLCFTVLQEPYDQTPLQFVMAPLIFRTWFTANSCDTESLRNHWSQIFHLRNLSHKCRNSTYSKKYNYMVLSQGQTSRHSEIIYILSFHFRFSGLKWTNYHFLNIFFPVSSTLNLFIKSITSDFQGIWENV